MAIAASTGLAGSGAELLSELNRLGKATKTRALLMVDAINEGNQEVWRDQLPRIGGTVGQLPHVGLVVSCRRPFDEAIVTEQAASRLLSLSTMASRIRSSTPSSSTSPSTTCRRRACHSSRRSSRDHSS